jgi:hypothetical protein
MNTKDVDRTSAYGTSEDQEVAKAAATQALGERGIMPADTVRLADVRVRERSGVWEVTVNGRFHGDYLREEHAVEAVVLAVRLAVADRAELRS